MSQLPNAALAHVEDVKVRDYLLNPGNLQNQGKAGQFERYGFVRDHWQVLADALCKHPTINPVVRMVSSPHGVKYVVECSLETPDHRNPCLRSVWIIEDGQDRPRLVTAY